MQAIVPGELARRRAVILRAAGGLLAIQPFTEPSMLAVSVAAGVPKMAITELFGSRDGLFAAVFLQEYRRFCAALVAATKPYQPQAMVALIRHWASIEPLFAHVMVLLPSRFANGLGPLLQPFFTAAYQAETARIARVLERQVPFFAAGDGAAFLLGVAQVLASNFALGGRPELASRYALTQLIGTAREFERRQAANRRSE